MPYKSINQSLIKELEKVQKNLDGLSIKKKELQEQVLKAASGLFYNSVWKDLDDVIVYSYNMFPDQANSYFVTFNISLLKYFDENCKSIEKILVTPMLDKILVKPEKVIEEFNSNIDKVHFNNGTTSCFNKIPIVEMSAEDFFNECACYFTNNINKIINENGLSSLYGGDKVNDLVESFKNAHHEFIEAVKLLGTKESSEYFKSIQTSYDFMDGFTQDIIDKNRTYLNYKLEKDLKKNFTKYKINKI